MKHVLCYSFDLSLHNDLISLILTSFPKHSNQFYVTYLFYNRIPKVTLEVAKFLTRVIRIRKQFDFNLCRDTEGYDLKYILK